MTLAIIFFTFIICNICEGGMELGSLKLHYEKVWNVYIKKHLFEGLMKRNFFNLKQHIYNVYYNSMVFKMNKIKHLPIESTYRKKYN